MSTECVRTNSVRLGILIRLNLVGFLLCPLGLRAETYVLKDSPEAVDSARADSSQKHTILLDTAHSYALWHVLTKTQPEKNELLQLETSSINGIINPEYQPQFQDIF